MSSDVARLAGSGGAIDRGTVYLGMSLAGGGGFRLAAAFFVLRPLGPSGSTGAAT